MRNPATRARKPAVFAAVLFVAAAAAAGCDGILGLDETKLRPADASVDGTTEASSDDAPSTADVTMQDGPLDGSGADGTSKPDAPAGDAGDAGSGDGSPVFTTSPATLGLDVDAGLSVQISVQRNGLAGALSVTFDPLPTGVTSSTSTIGADAGSTTVVVTAGAAAPVGAGTTNVKANGTTYTSVPLFVYGPSGTLDTTFSGGLVLDPAALGGVFNSVAIDSAGGIIAGGSGTGGNGWILQRYLPSGAPDTTFDTAAQASMPTSGNLNGVAIDAVTGNIVCVGLSTVGAGDQQLTIVVLDASGNAYGNFNHGSPFALSMVFTQASVGNAVAIAPGGLFVVAGSNTPAPNAYLMVLAEDSVPDQSPPAYQSGASSTVFYGVAVDSAGRILAAGTQPKGPTDVLLERFAPDGAVDTTFGEGGIAPETNVICQPRAVVVRPSTGKIFASGGDVDTDIGCFGQWTTAGAVSYGKEGTNGGGADFIYSGLAPMRDGSDRIYMVGYQNDVNQRSAELDRVATDGTFDLTFGGTGQVPLDSASSPQSYYFDPKAVAVQADGRIVIVGSKTVTSPAATTPFVARYWP